MLKKTKPNLGQLGGGGYVSTMLVHFVMYRRLKRIFRVRKKDTINNILGNNNLFLGKINQGL